MSERNIGTGEEQRDYFQEFKDKISGLKTEEKRAYETGESTAYHLQNLDVNYLTERDQALYRAFELASSGDMRVELFDEFLKAIKEEIVKIEDENERKNRDEFQAYLANLRMGLGGEIK